MSSMSVLAWVDVDEHTSSTLAPSAWHMSSNDLAMSIL